MLKSPKATAAQPKLNPQLMGLTATNLSVEELIGHAHRGATQPEADITLSNGETLSQQDKVDFHAAISKEIDSAIHQLRTHQVQIIGQPGDAPYIILARTLNELQRRAIILLDNENVPEDLKLAFQAIGTQETQESHSALQLIQISVALNSMDTALFEKALSKNLNTREMWLDWCKLTQLTPNMVESLANYTQLQWLHLEGNKLTTLPDAMGQLTKLKTMDLRENLLNTLPESMARLTSLSNLYLSDNRFTHLPESLRGVLQRTRNLEHYSHLLQKPSKSVARFAPSSSSSSSSGSSSDRSYIPRFLSSISSSISGLLSLQTTPEQDSSPIAGRTHNISKAESSRPTKKQKRR